MDFENYTLDSSGVFNGPAANAITETREYWYGPQIEQVGTFDVDGVNFSNSRSGSGWGGFAISNHTDTTTAGLGNQYSVFPGSGANGSNNYGVAAGYRDLVPTNFVTAEFILDPTNLAQLRQLPSLYLPENRSALSTQVSNTTYTALSMQNGDAFSKQFGGPSENDADFLRLSVFGIDENDQVLNSSVEFYLADFRFADNNEDYIIEDWTTLDLTPLSDARSLHFNLDSADSGDFGMNTPGYFAIDNFTLTAVPEPGAVLMLTLVLAGSFLRRRRVGTI